MADSQLNIISYKQLINLAFKYHALQMANHNE